MPRAAQSALHPRKTPVQARSAVTVDAILQATLQVLVAVGKEQLTTTRVAARAGVSVGTLYQYFPNKRSLLQAALRQHLTAIAESVFGACDRLREHSLFEMGSAIVDSYLDAKMQHVKVSAALYAVSSDVDGASIARTAYSRTHHQLAGLFASAHEPLTKDPDIVATMVFSALNGASRRILESGSPERQLTQIRDELHVLVRAYLETCVAL